MKALPLTAAPEFVAASATSTRLNSELASLDLQIAKFDAEKYKPQQFDPLTTALAFLEGSPVNSNAEQRAHLGKKRQVIFAGACVARENLNKLERNLSSAYMASRAPDVLKALDGLAAALQSVQDSSKAFETIRREAEELGFDASIRSLPVAIDQPLLGKLESDIANVREARTELDEALNCPATEPDMRIVVLTPIQQIEGQPGDVKTVPGKLGRSFVRAGWAEIQTRDARLKKALG